MTGYFDALAAPFEYQGDSGKAVVLVHGFTGVPAHFRPLAGFLSRHGVTAVVPLLAGHGTDPECLRTIGRDQWVQSVVRAYDSAAADHDHVHLAGLSMGGLLSVIVGQDRGAASVSTINSPIVYRNKRIHLARWLHRFRPDVSWPDEDPPDLDDDVTDYWLTYPWYPTVAAAELLDVSREARRTARKITCPALVVQSLADETVDPRSGAILAEALGPDTSLVWLQRSLHNALLDRERDAIHAAVLARVLDERTPGEPG